ncbi:MAG: YbaK/EbsC family protein [Candidatus Kerfeldbacteria bacterium]|nr:YbaK/EbsC family protein [Candidatus Kerfeldbacteria bacterium]
MNIPKNIVAHLKAAKAKFEVIPHKTVFTAYDLGQTLKARLEEIAKTLLVKADNAYHLVVLRASDRLDLTKLKKFLGAKSLRIATEKDMARELKVKPGAITPFGKVHKLTVVVDRGLAKVKQALFGSGSFQHAIRMKVAHYLKLEEPRVGAFGKKTGLKLQAKPVATSKRAISPKSR